MFLVLLEAEIHKRKTFFVTADAMVSIQTMLVC